MSSRLHEREPESRAIVDALDEVVAGRGRVVMVEGPAGIGKTSLLELGADAARAGNVAVASARGSDLELPYAWGVTRQLFQPRLRGMSADTRSRTVAGAAALAGAGPVLEAVQDDEVAFRDCASELDALAGELGGQPFGVLDERIRPIADVRVVLGIPISDVPLDSLARAALVERKVVWGMLDR